MEASLHALHADYIHKDEDLSVGFEWDAFALGCAHKLYPSLKHLPLDLNESTASAYFLGIKLGEYAQEPDKVKKLIEHYEKSKAVSKSAEISGPSM